MKLVIADKFKHLFDVLDSNSTSDIMRAQATVMEAKKRIKGDILLQGEDGVHIPAKVEYTGGEAPLTVGDILQFQIETGLVTKRILPEAPKATKVSNSGTPDRSSKQQGM
jgi:hypothetical protein